MKTVAFDMGGTLMEYVGMPLSWTGYYYSAFKQVAKMLGLSLSESDIGKSCEALTALNPRISGRIQELSPEIVFHNATTQWHTDAAPIKIAEMFYNAMGLRPFIYQDSLPCLKWIKENGLKTAALTDLPTGMPDSVFREDIKSLLPFIDVYVSSGTCGYRKPDPCGLLLIASKLQIDASALLFVGDEQKDMMAARNAGCPGVLMDRKKKCPDYGQAVAVSNLKQNKRNPSRF